MECDRIAKFTYSRGSKTQEARKSLCQSCGKVRIKNKPEKKNQRGNKGPLKVNESSAKIHKEQKKDMCHFCKKIGHYKEDCLKRKIWFDKKGKPSAFICFKSNLA